MKKISELYEKIKEQDKYIQQLFQEKNDFENSNIFLTGESQELKNKITLLNWEIERLNKVIDANEVYATFEKTENFSVEYEKNPFNVEEFLSKIKEKVDNPSEAGKNWINIFH